MKTYAIILAAGKGTRFGMSATNKTAIQISGIPIIRTGIKVISSLVDEVVVVVGHKQESVRSSLKGIRVHYVVQKQQRGTGHAVNLALEYIQARLAHPRNVVIANGDHLFQIDPETLTALLKKHQSSGSDVSILTTTCRDPKEFDNGRIIRSNNRIIGIKEKKDLSKNELLIRELNTGTYVCSYKELFKVLSKQSPEDNGEVYITKAIFKLPGIISSYTAPIQKVGKGINTRAELRQHLIRLRLKSFHNILSTSLAKFLFLFTIFIILQIKLVTLSSLNDFLFFKTYSVLVSLYILSRFLISFFYRPHSSMFDYDFSPTISYVIPCKNEEENIANTMVKIAEQNYDKKKMEIIVINDGSTDGTLKEMQLAARKVRLKGIKVRVIDWKDNRGKREGMAEGARQSKSELIFYVDSDSFLEADATKEIIKYFKSSNVAAVAGHAYVANADENAVTKMQAVRYFVAFKAYKASESLFGTVTCCSGCCSVYRKSALLTILPSWENQKFLGQKCTYGDDRSLTNYLLKKNYDALYAPEAGAYTIVPNTLAKFARQQLRWKKSWCRESLIAATFMFNKNPIASFFYYLGIILPVLAPFIVVRALVIFPLQYRQFPWFYLAGLLLMAILYGLFYYIHTRDKKWIYGVVFAAYYTLVLIWQLPYAIFTIKDTRWGTR